MKPTTAMFIKDLNLIDPETKAEVSLSVYKDKTSGALIGVDSSWFDTFSDDEDIYIPSLFNAEQQCLLVESDLPKFDNYLVIGRLADHENTHFRCVADSKEAAVKHFIETAIYAVYSDALMENYSDDDVIIEVVISGDFQVHCNPMQ